MAQAFYQQGMLAPATFSLFIRNYPPDRGYFVSAGLEDVLDYLENLRFSPASLDYLRSTGIFTDDLLQYLSKLRFTGSVRAIPEGRLFFANEPVLEVTAPIIEAQLSETFIINQMNFQVLLASKAARCCWAAPGRVISDFATRRTHGVDAALKMARCGYIAGFQSTSNVLAAQRYGIPPAGTMAHSFITSFPSESEAFRAYAAAFPGRTVLLLDTYDTIEGAWRAVPVAKELEAAGRRLLAVRLDSGDFADLSRRVRRILDEAGLEYVQILASGGLDEFELESLVKGGAPIDIFGVGTKVGVSADAPYSDMADKLVVYDGRPVMKLSPGKVSPPGAKQVFRLRDESGKFLRDIIAREDERLPGGERLLEPVMAGGRRTGPQPTLDEMRSRFQQDFQQLDDHHKRLRNPPRYPVVASPSLERLTLQVQDQIASAEQE
ncbi:MAG: nicotinate phosphoribosyltransferase [Dehalococcoidia bacterium]|nr:nicotinate phosphoribosyltransferase [Dehalococcoidia bacterium]MSQ17706.1 nicotinate phosphoribosyltransferase [Dehalococcoidia bacterium]